MNAESLVSSAKFLLVCLMFISCGDKYGADPCCVLTDLPRDASVKDGQGMLRVQGSTAVYFYVLDESGKDVGYQMLNQNLPLDEGKYSVKVNNSLCALEIKSGSLSTCFTGALIVQGNTPEYYYVADSTNRDLGYELTGKAMSFFPGSFKVKLNNTELAVKVSSKEMTEIRSGTLIVHGGTEEYYYVLDSANRQLNYNLLEKPLAFFPGTYPVKVNNSSMTAIIAAGKATELSTGCLLVKGLTDEYYYVSDTTGRALNYQILNKPLAFFPGKVQVKINNTLTLADISAADTTEFLTGSLMLTGVGTEYYYVLDESGKQLNYNSLNKSLSFFPSQYTIKLGQSTRKAMVKAGELTSVAALEQEPASAK